MGGPSHLQLETDKILGHDTTPLEYNIAEEVTRPLLGCS